MAYLAVAFGGALGAVLRYIIGQLIPQAKSGFPYATMFANLVGCLLLGAFYVLIVERSAMSGYWRELLIVGFCGGLTTFSSFSLEALQLWLAGHTQTALLYIVLSVVFCIVATLISISLLRLL